MKILVFVKTFANPTLTFIYNEVTELAKNHEVRVLTCERKHPDRFPFGDVETLPFEQNEWLAKIRYKLQVLDFEAGFKKSTFAKQLSAAIETFQPDVIHTHFGFESWLLLLNFRRTDIPIFISFHGYDASHKLNSLRYRTTLKKLLKRPNLYPIFVSNFMQKQVEARLQMSIPQAQILYYGTDVDFFKRTRTDYPKTPFIFLQVSSFAVKKGHQYTVRAFAKLLQRLDSEAQTPSKRPLLILAGEGSLRNEIEQLCQKLGISDSVQFPGLVNQTQARELMEKAHAFVHHSVTSKPIGDMEGIPNALMEAMAMELPVLSTFHSGIPELVKDGLHGFLVAEEDVENYAQKMYEILKWGYLPKNRAKVVAQFEKQQHAQQLVAYYKNVLKPWLAKPFLRPYYSW